MQELPTHNIKNLFENLQLDYFFRSLDITNSETAIDVGMSESIQLGAIITETPKVGEDPNQARG